MGKRKAVPRCGRPPRLVGARGFEPPTPTTPLWCATRLRYAPTHPYRTIPANTRQASPPAAPDILRAFRSPLLLALTADQRPEDGDHDGTEERRDDAHALDREVERQQDVRLEEPGAEDRPQHLRQHTADFLPGQPLGDAVGGDRDDHDDDQADQGDLVAPGWKPSHADREPTLMEDVVQDAAVWDEVEVLHGQQHRFPFSSSSLLWGTCAPHLRGAAAAPHTRTLGFPAAVTSSCVAHIAPPNRGQAHPPPGVGCGDQLTCADAVQIGACHHTSRTSGHEQVARENEVSRDRASDALKGASIVPKELAVKPKICPLASRRATIWNRHGVETRQPAYGRKRRGYGVSSAWGGRIARLDDWAGRQHLRTLRGRGTGRADRRAGDRQRHQFHGHRRHLRPRRF